MKVSAFSCLISVKAAQKFVNIVSYLSRYCQSGKQNKAAGRVTLADALETATFIAELELPVLPVLPQVYARIEHKLIRQRYEPSSHPNRFLPATAPW